MDSTKEPIKVAITTIGIGKKNLPKKPGMVRIGIKATIVVRTAKVTGIDTLFVPMTEALTPGPPCFWNSVNILSPTIIASSTTIPNTNMKPKSEARLMVTSNTGKTINAPKKEIGIPSMTKNANEGLRNKVKIIKTRISP